ncbi:hypothetical protein ACW95P_03470 [Candidatus Mycoplasma pogonae]
MIFKKKKLLKFFASFSVMGTSLVAVACSTAKNEWADSKKIVLAVDGKQKEFYDEVSKEFAKTESYKQGFRLELINVDVFGALDRVGVFGFPDEKVPDLFYAPQDRVTSLLQSNSITSWNQETINKILNSEQATEAEKQKIASFGNVPVSATETRFYALPHNIEGIVMMSNKPLVDVKNELSNVSTDSLQELVDAGKGFFRIQDFWYGNGLLAGTFGSELVRNILYKNGTKWSSGFLKKDPNHTQYLKAITSAAKLWYPAWQLGYSANPEKSPYFGKIDASDMRVLMGNNMDAVQNKVLQLLNDKKLEYALVGSWDIFNSVNKGVDSFVNVPKVNDVTNYLQAPGSWSYLLNARNNAVSKERKEAIEQVLDLIFKKQSYYEYFKVDSKVPYIKHIQDLIKKETEKELNEITEQSNKFAIEAGFADYAELLKTFNDRFSAVEKILNEAVPSSGGNWQSSTEGDPLADAAITAAPKKPSADLLVGATPAILEKLSNLQFEKTIGLRNAIAALLGLEKIEDLKGDGQTWQVGSEVIKPGVQWEETEVQNQEKNTAHMRKLEKLIFGQNGDSQDELKALIDKVNKQGFQKVLDETIKNAITFNKKYSKVELSKEDITRIVTLYFNNIKNKAAWDKLVEEYQPIFYSLVFKKKDGTDSAKTNLEVSTMIKVRERGSVFDIVMNVLTSTQKLPQGLGELKTQSGRFDNLNPQFGPSWGNWNDNTFGNSVFLSQINKNSTEAQFIKAIEDKLDSLFEKTISVLDKTDGSSDKVKVRI